MTVEEALEKAKAGELKNRVQCEDGTWVCKHGHHLKTQPIPGRTTWDWFLTSKKSHICNRCVRFRSRSSCEKRRDKKREYNAIWRMKNKCKIYEYRRLNCIVNQALFGAASRKDLLRKQETARKRKEAKEAFAKLTDEEFLHLLCKKAALRGNKNEGATPEAIELRASLTGRLGKPNYKKGGLNAAKTLWLTIRTGIAEDRRGSARYIMTELQKYEYDAVCRLAWRWDEEYGWWDADVHGENHPRREG